MSTFNKIYKKISNNGNANDYQAVATVGVNGIDLGIMKGASSSVDGEIGLVPKPTKGQQNRYLRADGTWQTPPDTNTTYDVFNGSNDGLVPKTDKSHYFLTGNGSWGYPWIGSWVESGKTLICLGSGDDQLSKNELPEATETSNGLMTSAEKRVLWNILMRSPFASTLFAFDDDINFGTLTDSSSDKYVSQSITHYIYKTENSNDDGSKYYTYWYPLLKMLVDNGCNEIKYEPLANGCTFGNIESIWNGATGSISATTKDGIDCIKMQYYIYAKARTHCGKHSVIGRSHTMIYLSTTAINLIKTIYF